jgi:hypothetical protein
MREKAAISSLRLGSATVCPIADVDMPEMNEDDPNSDNPYCRLPQ